jgi:hypothetical protein
MNNLTNYPLLVFALAFFGLWLSARIGSSLLWHGNAEEALERIGGLNIELDLLRAFSPPADKLGKSLGEFETYIRNNIEFIPNFGERYQPGGKGFAGNPGAPPPQEYPHQRAPSAS